MAVREYSALRVGVLVATGLALLIFGILSVGKTTRFLTRTEVLSTHFRRTSGLQKGAAVTLSGVNIGAVESITFPEDPTADYVVVEFWVEGVAAPRIRIDSIATIKSMGLLGDKFVELIPGSPNAPPAQPGDVLKSQEPLDYEALLRKTGTDDFIANVLSLTTAMRSILESIDKGSGILSELVHGGKGQQLTLESVRDTLLSVDRMSDQLAVLLDKINRGQGVAGALFSPDTNGRQLFAQLSSTATSLQQTSARLDRLIDRYQKAQGTVPRLFEDQQYADELLANVRQSSSDLKAILQKINSGQGTMGQIVNDPALYNEAKTILANGGGWGFSMLRGIYAITHPFSDGSREAFEPPGACHPIADAPPAKPAPASDLSAPASR